MLVSRARALLQPNGFGLWLVPPQTAPALRPSPLAAANSQRPADHRALDPCKTCVRPNPPSRLLPPAFGLRLPPLWNRPLSPASASPLSLKLSLRLTSTCRVFRSRWTPLRAPTLPVPSETVLEASACASTSRPALPDSPSGVRLPVPGSRPAPSVCPSSLPSRLPSGFRPPASAPAPPRARSAFLNSRLAPAVPAARALSNPTDDLLRGHRLLRTLSLPNLCTQVQNRRILWIT